MTSKTCSQLVKVNLLFAVVVVVLVFSGITRYPTADFIPSKSPPFKKINITGTETKKPKILIWILADPILLNSKVIHQKATWGKRCDKLLILSSEENKQIPAIGLNGTLKGRQHIDIKTKVAWKYIYKHYINDYDFFMKVDTDTFVVVENLVDFLSYKDPTKPYFYGHQYTNKKWSYSFVAGGPGEVLTRETLNLLVNQVFIKHDKCWPDGAVEDLKLGKCLKLVGAVPQETRDKDGKERFIVFHVSGVIRGNFRPWYYKYHYKIGITKGEKCCSDYPISFHYVTPAEMYALEYWLYHSKVHGYEKSSPPWPKIIRISK